MPTARQHAIAGAVAALLAPGFLVLAALVLAGAVRQSIALGIFWLGMAFVMGCLSRRALRLSRERKP
jgi:hypothetical protein